MSQGAGDRDLIASSLGREAWIPLQPQQPTVPVVNRSCRRASVTWQNGKHTEVDASDYLQAPGYERLRDPAFFANVQVEEWGHGVEWPAADIGIPADALYRLSKEQTGDAFPTGQFNAWMKRHGLSLSTAAQALHLTRRTIIYYSTGAKPIPAYIGLACKGWEVAHRNHAA